MVVLGLLLVFEVWSIYCFIRMLRNGRKSLVDYVLIVAFVLFNFQFMFEASAINSKYIFAMGLFVYGMVTSSVVIGEKETTDETEKAEILSYGEYIENMMQVYRAVEE